MELRTRGLGAALLRELAGRAYKWQRLKPYEKFAEMIDRHWDGIAAYCRLENKVSLGFLSKGSTTRSGSSSGAPTACSNEDYLRLKESGARLHAAGAIAAAHLSIVRTAVSEPASPRPTRSTHERG